MTCFLKEFLNWKSHTSLKDCVLKENLNAALIHYIQELETKFGQLLVTHALSKRN